MEYLYQWLPILGVIIAGIFALYQMKMNAITNIRLKWLDEFKQDISELYQVSLLTANHQYQIKMFESDRELWKGEYQGYVKAHSRFFVLSNRLKLTILESSEHQERLSTIITELQAILAQDSTGYDKQPLVISKLEELKDHCTILVNLEWNRLSRLF